MLIGLYITDLTEPNLIGRDGRAQGGSGDMVIEAGALVLADKGTYTSATYVYIYVYICVCKCMYTRICRLYGSE